MNLLKRSLLSFVVFFALLIGTILIYHYFFVPKVRYIKTAELVDKYAGMKEAKDQYKKKIDQWQSNIDTLENDYRRLQLKYETQKISLKPSERLVQEQNLSKQEVYIREYVENIEKLAEEEDSKMTKTVLNQINQFIEEYSKKHGYDVVLGTNVSGTLLYGNQNIDITADILVALNNYYLDKK